LTFRATLNNLLIVEDNLFIGKEIFNATKKLSNIEDVLLAKSLQEAISIFKETRFDIVILDLKLPDGNGIELLKLLKETKVLVFSISTELKQTCLNHGAFAFYDKAKEFDKLIEAIKTLP